jgi:hypothetical protein
VRRPTDREPDPRLCQCLHGWKSIANYLGKSTRTVQRWEREMDLPIHRLPAAKADTVFAFPDELDAWLLKYTSDSDQKEEVEQLSPDGSEIETPTPLGFAKPATGVEKAAFVSRRSASAIAVGFCIIFVVTAVLIGTRWNPKGREMASFRLENNLLVVLDSDGSEQWRHVFQQPLDPLAYNSNRKVAEFVDVDGDGQKEFLFSYIPSNYREFSSILYCFGRNGRELWHYAPGKKIRTGDEEFDPPFHIYEFAVVPSSPAKKIVLVSEHHMFFPSVADLLSDKGEVLGEYWHSGQMRSPVVMSPANDGHYTVLLGAPDNEFRAASLVALDIDHFPNGASAQVNPHYQILDMPIARESVRLLFQRSCINRLRHPNNHVAAIILENGAPTVLVGETLEGHPAEVIYQFSSKLELRDVSVGDDFLTLHKEFENRHELDHAFTNGELKRFWNVTSVPPFPNQNNR